MAEAFGVGAGIVGVLGLTIQITQVVVQFWSDWKHAPSDVTDFMRELQSLKTVLSETRTNLEDPNFEKAFQDRPSVLQSALGPNTPTMDETKVSIELCRVELERVLRELKTRDRGNRLGWERFKGPFLAKSTRDSVDKLRHYGQLFNNMASIDAMTLAVTTWTGVKEVRREQQEWHNDEKNEAILHWISSLSFEERQRDILSNRHPGTGQWLLDKEVFQHWRNGVLGEPSVLWCPGIAGAGKSVITSIVIEHLQQFFTKNNVSISYIYCDYKDRKTQTVVNLISSLVKQIVLQQKNMSKEVNDLYAEYKNGQSSLTLEKYSKLLASLSTYFRRSFIIVDALDEHMISDDAENSVQMTLLDILLQHQWNGSDGYTLFFTSRHIGLVQERLAKCAHLEIRAADSDIELYLRSRIRNSNNFRVLVKKVQDEAKFIDQMIRPLVKNAQGMFLLPRLQLDQLEFQTSVRDLRTALEYLPTKLDGTYDDAMSRIQNQVPEYSKLAMSALSWISNALRPLKQNELQHALAVRRGDQSMDEEALVDETLLVSVSAGLITLDAQSETIRLAHFTVEQYFEERKQALFPNADIQIAETCLTYLSFDVFETGPCPSLEKLQTRLQQNWFLKYASLNWGHHALRADEHIDEDLAVRFLTNNQMMSCCNQAKLDDALRLEFSFHEKYRPRKGVQSSGLHLAAQFGLLSIFKKLLERGNGADSKGYLGQTPLTLSVIGGHVQMVKFLVDQDDVSAESRDENGRTPLSHAASQGYTEIVKLLVARDDISAESRDRNGYTSLSYAASQGYTEIVKLLVARDDVSAESRDENGRTPLSHAASQGHAEIVKLLVARDDVSAESRDENGRTPLSHAASSGHTEIVKLLVARDDVSAESRDENGHTPLSHAASQGHAEIVKLLVARGDVIVDSRDNYGWTPLSRAALQGYTEIVKLLIARDDVLAESRDDYGRTPLSWVASKGYEVILKLLLGQPGVLVDSQDNCGQTPLSFAAFLGREVSVALLLDCDKVVADSRDNSGRTPLSYAALRGNIAVMKLLLDRVDVVADSRDNYGRTPLSYAARRGNLAVMKLLLDRGDVVADSRDNYGRTPLSYAAAWEDEVSVKLLDRGADSRDSDGHTPLYYATRNRHHAMVQLLENKLRTSSTENAAEVDQ